MTKVLKNGAMKLFKNNDDSDSSSLPEESKSDSEEKE